jgi:hypothetical protein
LLNVASIQKLSAQVIDYAERVSEIADVAQGKHQARSGRTTRWLLLPASGAALYALIKSDSFSRQAKDVMDEAKSRASELPEDLLTRVRQSASSKNGSQSSSSTTRSRSTGSARKTTASRKRSPARKTTAASR